MTRPNKVEPGQVWVRAKLVRIVWEVGDDNGRPFVRWTRPGWKTKPGGGTRVWADEFEGWCLQAEMVATIAKGSTEFDAAAFFNGRLTEAAAEQVCNAMQTLCEHCGCPGEPEDDMSPCVECSAVVCDACRDAHQTCFRCDQTEEP